VSESISKHQEVRYFIQDRKHVLSHMHTHAGFENRNGIIAPNRATRFDLLTALLRSVVLEEKILSQETD